MTIWRLRVATLLLLLFLPRHAQACDMVCAADNNYEVMLKKYEHVLVGRVEVIADDPHRATFTVSAVRVWKGSKKTITLVNTSGMCGMTPRNGRLYLVFANEDPQGLSMCSPVFGLWEERAKIAITRLDRVRGLPPLSVPADDLRP